MDVARALCSAGPRVTTPRPAVHEAVRTGPPALHAAGPLVAAATTSWRLTLAAVDRRQAGTRPRPGTPRRTGTTGPCTTRTARTTSTGRTTRTTPSDDLLEESA